MNSTRVRTSLCLLFSFGAVFAAGNAAAQMDPAKAKVIEHWTGERRASAIPRDLVIDPRGLGYLRRSDGSLAPYGHDVAAQATERAQASPPSGAAAPASGDSTPPSVSNMNPGANQTIGALYTFSATVTDPSGVKSVTFKIQKAGSNAQSFSAARTSDPDVWSIALQGFTDGDWSWWVEAKDGASRGGNSGSSTTVNFKVSTGTSGGDTGDTSGTVTNAHWTGGGTVTSASGRLYFEMPGNAKKKIWWGYVCSGSVATDDTAERSVIVTAAHCVYDDQNKAFARNVMFIPDQDGTTGSATDRNCSNDPLGCWVASFGVVDVNWTTRTFPDNIAWDYGFYVVADSGAHQGNGSSSVLDAAAGNLWIDFNLPSADDGQAGANSPDYTYALGYSYSDDPKLMYCAEGMTTEGAVNWWLPHCGLSGGSSGGPWIQPMVGGTGPIISFNSWGYTSSPGMAGPKLVGTSAACVFGAAKTGAFQNPLPPDGEAGIAATCE